MSYSAYCLRISCYILHIILHIYFHILYSAYYFAYFLHILHIYVQYAEYWIVTILHIILHILLHILHIISHILLHILHISMYMQHIWSIFCILCNESDRKPGCTDSIALRAQRTGEARATASRGADAGRAAGQPQRLPLPPPPRSSPSLPPLPARRGKGLRRALGQRGAAPASGDGLGGRAGPGRAGAGRAGPGGGRAARRADPRLPNPSPAHRSSGWPAAPVQFNHIVEGDRRSDSLGYSCNVKETVNCKKQISYSITIDSLQSELIR